ncbi:MAG: ABC transporter ATP-binding protein [Methanocorpusculum sp.]|nr:ABC transporter ATP-binding protein [Methanocorpusculum sp.]
MNRYDESVSDFHTADARAVQADEVMSLSGVRYRYGKHQDEVLRGVSFAAKRGDFIAVLGPNGVGKSTMFKCLLGFFKTYGGDIRLWDKDIRTLSHKEIAKQIAYIPQSTYPTFNYEVLDVVLMGLTAQLSALSSPKKEHIRRAEEALKSLGIGNLAHAGFGEISGGERQLVLIARALVQDAKILIMDEPTANLDYGNQFRVMCRVEALAHEGYVVILSTHNPEHAFLYANRVLILNGGEVIADGAPDAVLDEEMMHRVYGIDVSIKEISNEDGAHRVCVPRKGVSL